MTELTPGCQRPDLSEHVAPFCFGDLQDHERDTFALHLLQCEHCWSEVHHLQAVVSEIRHDKQLTRPISSVDIVPLLGISGRIEEILGGHWWFALLASTAYGLLYALALVAEVAHEFDRFRGLAFAGGAGLAMWFAGTLVAALAVDWRLVRRGSSRGLSVGALVALGAAAVGVAIVMAMLPEQPIVRMSVQAHTAEAGVLKAFKYFVPLALVFILMPFHFVVTCQYELHSGRHRLLWPVLVRDRTAVAPRGTIVPRPGVLAAVLLASALYAFMSTSYLLDHIVLGAYTNLFTNLTHFGVALFFTIGFGALGWLYRCLNELKRECMAINRMSPPTAVQISRY